MKILSKLFGCGKSTRYAIEIKEGDSGKYYWRLMCVGNHEPLAHSESYETPAACADTAMNVGEDAGFEVTVIQ